MKTFRQLAPLGLIIALVSALTWYLLDQGAVAGEWLLAGLLLAHGWVHLMFVFPMPARAAATAGGPAWPFDLGQSWLIRGLGLEGGLVRALGIGLMAFTCACSLLAALATVGLVVTAGWWAALVLGAAAGSFLLLALAWSPLLLLGLGIDLALVWLALWSGWDPVA